MIKGARISIPHPPGGLSSIPASPSRSPQSHEPRATITQELPDPQLSQSAKQLRNGLTLEKWHHLASTLEYSASRISSAMGVSRRQLERYSLRDLGASPQEWLDNQKLLDALTLLEPHKSVKAVSYELGFKHPSHFSTKFKQKYGISPSAYLAEMDAEACVACSCSGWFAEMSLRHK